MEKAPILYAPSGLGISSEAIERMAKTEEPLASNEPAFVPIYDRIIVEQDQAENVYVKGGNIVVPSEYRQHVCTGTVVDIGINCRKSVEDSGTQIGDRIMWAKYAGISGPKDGVSIPWKTKNVIVLMAKDIVANFTLAERLEREEWVIERSTETGDYRYAYGPKFTWTTATIKKAGE